MSYDISSNIFIYLLSLCNTENDVLFYIKVLLFFAFFRYEVLKLYFIAILFTITLI